MKPEEFEDWLEGVISDSLCPEWTPRVAAQHAIENLSPRNGWQLSRIGFTWENPDGPSAA